MNYFFFLKNSLNLQLLILNTFFFEAIKFYKFDYLKLFFFFLKKKKFKKKNFFFNYFFEYFFKKKLERHFFQKTFLNIVNLAKGKNNFFNRKKFLKIFKKNTANLALDFYFLKKVFVLVFESFKYCDSFLFLFWFKQILESSELKKHKLLIKWIVFLIKNIFKLFGFILKIKGLYLRIKGKVGLSGASKKKRITFKFKKFSLSNFTSKINYAKTSVRTNSGALGIIFFLVF